MEIGFSFFYLFSSIGLISAFMVIFALNPVHSVFFLVLVFFNGAAMLFLMKVEFLAMLFLIVYVGAIAVLFLFVIMMLNIKIMELNQNLFRYLPVGGMVCLLFFLETVLTVNNSVGQSFNALDNVTFEAMPWIATHNWVLNIGAVGSFLYNEYASLFLLSALILLVAMVGTIVLTLNVIEITKKQHIFGQVSLNESKLIERSL